MKEERNINIEVSNPAIVREYIAYMEGKEARKRERVRRTWSNIGNAVLAMLCGAGISMIIMLSAIGLAVVL